MGVSCFLRTFVGMIELSTHIEYLLLFNDEVSVPQLGTFVVKYMRSHRVDEEGIFLPPYRSVTFHPDKQEEGEEFILSLSKLHNVSRHEARLMCVEYVDELQQTLCEDGSVSLGSMGYLLYGAENDEIVFMPQQSGIASPTYYGLDAVPFSKLSHEVRQHRDKKKADKKTRLTSIQADRDTITIRINRRAFNYAAAVAASIVLFFAITSPFGKSITSDISQKAEFFSSTKILPEAKPLQPMTDHREEAKSFKAMPVIPEVPKEEKVNHQKPTANDYAIVLASAISKKSAVNFAEILKKQGYEALACEFGGMVRVIIPGFASGEEALAEIRRMKADSKDFANAWPCYVKEEIKLIEQ